MDGNAAIVLPDNVQSCVGGMVGNDYTKDVYSEGLWNKRNWTV